MKLFYLSLKENIPANDYWAYGMLNDLIASKCEYKEVNKLPKTDKAIVVIPGEYHADVADEVNTQLQKIDRVVLFVMADEEAKFPVEQINHPNIDIWIQYPHQNRHEAYNKLGGGYPLQLKETVKDLTPDKTLRVFFSGQLTHQRRIEMYEAVQVYTNGDPECDVFGTNGFTQGYPQAEYYKKMVSSKVAPCAAGTIVPDSFRVYEALECMAIPIADQKNSQATFNDYWQWLLGQDPPFPTIKEWDSFAGYTNEVLDDWPTNMHRQTAWWIKYKRDLTKKVLEQANG